MSQQQNVIRKFMHSLDETKQQGTAALDEAVRACSQFSSYQDLVNHFISDAEQAGNYQSFLRNSCGIILDNKDTGAITGADAGGSVVKTAESIVPEPADGRWSYSYYTSRKTGEVYVNIRGVQFVYASSMSAYKSYTQDEKFIADCLCGWWVGNALDLIESSYGMSFNEQGTRYKRMRLVFMDDSSDWTLARCGTEKNPYDSHQTDLVLTVNVGRYRNIARGGVNGTSKSTGTYYLDRTIAHELTHAIMETNDDYWWELPDLVFEGMAELTHGIDDERKEYIEEIAKNPEQMQRLMYADAKQEHDILYAGGYTLLRYLAKQGASGAGTTTTTTPTETNTTTTTTTTTTTAPGFDRLADGTLHARTNGGDIYIGAQTPSTIRGGSDPAAMWGGGAASDTFIAGTGKDYFWIGTGDGSDRVQGFKKGTDAIYCWNGCQTLQLMASGDDLIMSPGGATLTLSGVMASEQGEVGILAPGRSEDSSVTVGSFALNGTRYDMIDASGYAGESILIGGTTASALIAGEGKCAMWGGGSAMDCLVGSGSNTTYFWFGKGDGEDAAYSTSGKDAVFLWNISDINAVGVSREAQLESGMQQMGSQYTQLTQLTIGSDTLTIVSANGRPDLMLGNGATYRVTERGSGVSLTRIR